MLGRISRQLRAIEYDRGHRCRNASQPLLGRLQNRNVSPFDCTACACHENAGSDERARAGAKFFRIPVSAMWVPFQIESCGAHKFWQFWSFIMYGWYIAFGFWPISSFQLISMPKRKGWVLTRVKRTKDWSFPYSDKADSSSRSSLDVHSGNHRSVITTWWFPTMGAPQ